MCNDLNIITNVSWEKNFCRRSANCSRLNDKPCRKRLNKDPIYLLRKLCITYLGFKSVTICFDFTSKLGKALGN